MRSARPAIPEMKALRCKAFRRHRTCRRRRLEASGGDGPRTPEMFTTLSGEYSQPTVYSRKFSNTCLSASNFSIWR